MSLQEELAALGVEMIEDDHLVTLRCGDKEQAFSALGATQESLKKAAEEMATERRMHLWRKRTRNRRSRRRDG